MKSIEELARIATEARAAHSNVAAGWDELSNSIRETQIVGMQAALDAYLASIGEGFPSVKDCRKTWNGDGFDGVAAVRNLMLAAFVKKMEAVAKLPEKWRD